MEDDKTKDEKSKPTPGGGSRFRLIRGQKPESERRPPWTNDTDKLRLDLATVAASLEMALTATDALTDLVSLSFQNHEARIAAVEGRLDAMDSRMDALELRLEALEARLEV